MRTRRLALALVVGALVAEHAAALGWLAVRFVRAPSFGPVERGRRVAGSLACLGCHGPGGEGGVQNPGAETGQVPAWSGRTLMMYAESDAEIREWILEGATARRRAAPDYQKQREAAPVRMPGYRGRVRVDELDDLVAYVKAVGWFDDPPAGAVAHGRDVAYAQGCFGCHGPAGQGRIANPGSFKGYVPGWDGPDFAELVRDEQELEEWILDGVTRRFAADPVARFLLERQLLNMPAYRERLAAEELQALKAYVRWVQDPVR